MIKYFVRTTKERQLDSSYSQIEYELLIDNEHKPVDSFIQQLELIDKYDSILLEDDLILCENFKDEIEKVISQYPNKIINFFTYPALYFTTRENDIFCYNQCTYYPKGISNKVAQEMKRLRNKYNSYDTLENRALKELKIKHIIYRPCLVQHKDINTLIQNNHKQYGRTTIFFINYLKKLSIDYSNANSEMNRQKLIESLNEDIKTWK